ncbi:MAG: hypothetical protein QXW75_02470 [Thermoplasmatales archaeon]
MARLNISVTNEIAKKIQEVADRDGKTVSSVISESFDLYARLMDAGFTKGQIFSLIKYCQMTKAINAVPIPGNLLDQSVNIAMRDHGDEMMKIACEGGRVLGELMKSIFPDIDSLISNIKELSSFIPVSKIDLKKEEAKVEFILVGSGYSIGAAKVTSWAARCFFEAFGVKNMVETMSEGFVKITGTI